MPPSLRRSRDCGVVAEILLKPQRGAPMDSVDRARGLMGKGLVADEPLRQGASPHKNLTLIEAEKIEDFCKATGLLFSGQDARRNIVTRGIDLNALLGKEFYVGTVKVLAFELCEPCTLLAKRTHRAVLWGLLHKGGLRCEIKSDGVSAVGDEVRSDLANG